jgi:hypothetical protein
MTPRIARHRPPAARTEATTAAKRGYPDVAPPQRVNRPLGCSRRRPRPRDVGRRRGRPSSDACLAVMCRNSGCDRCSLARAGRAPSTEDPRSHPGATRLRQGYGGCRGREPASAGASASKHTVTPPRKSCEKSEISEISRPAAAQRPVGGRYGDWASRRAFQMSCRRCGDGRRTAGEPAGVRLRRIWERASVR